MQFNCKPQKKMGARQHACMVRRSKVFRLGQRVQAKQNRNNKKLKHVMKKLVLHVIISLTLILGMAAAKASSAAAHGPVMHDQC